jgi:uncharacterized membrane protein
MKAVSLNETIALAAITGMRSMAGPAAVALRYDGALRRLVPVMAAAEMIADKTRHVGDRTDPLPLAGRAAMGALVGGFIAREHDDNQLLGALVGAATAVLAAELAFRVRKALPWSSVLGGMIEDGVVMAIAALAANGAGGKS